MIHILCREGILKLKYVHTNINIQVCNKQCKDNSISIEFFFILLGIIKKEAKRIIWKNFAIVIQIISVQFPKDIASKNVNS